MGWIAVAVMDLANGEIAHLNADGREAFRSCVPVERELTRIAGPSGDKCGAVWLHRAGWRVEHCGHPTAHFPYLVVSPDGTAHKNPQTGRAFRHLKTAKAHLRELI